MRAIRTKTWLFLLLLLSAMGLLSITFIMQLKLTQLATSTTEAQLLEQRQPKRTNVWKGRSNEIPPNSKYENSNSKTTVEEHSNAKTNTFSVKQRQPVGYYYHNDTTPETATVTPLNEKTDEKEEFLSRLPRHIPWTVDQKYSHKMTENFSIDEYNRTIYKEHLSPTFIIIGGQKCGTTSMFEYLLQHPQVLGLIAKNTKLRALGNKEVRFFDSKYSKGFEFYAKIFANVEDIDHIEKKLITGEATPNYLYIPGVARKIYKHLPHIKLIVMIRNPVKRAFSHYHHAMLSGKRRNVTFEELIDSEMRVIDVCRGSMLEMSPMKEKERIDWEVIYERFMECLRVETGKDVTPSKTHNIEGRKEDVRYIRDIVRRKPVKNPEGKKQNRDSGDLRTPTNWFKGKNRAELDPAEPDPAEPEGKPKKFGWLQQLLSRGLYSLQLKQFTKYFPPTQLMIINSEHFFQDAEGYMNKITKFLDIGPFDWRDIVAVKHNFGRKNKIEVSNSTMERYERMNPTTRRILEGFFQDWNYHLANEFGSDYYWPLTPSSSSSLL